MEAEAAGECAEVRNLEDEGQQVVPALPQPVRPSQMMRRSAEVELSA
jgi:hypothetical protein